MSETNLFSVVEYENAAGVETFNIPFPYLRRSHIFVFVHVEPEDPEEEPTVGELVRGIHWEFDGDHSIRILEGTTIEPDQILTIRRITIKGQRLAAYHDGSRLTEVELNDVTLQLLYLIQEIDDFERVHEGGGFIPGDGDDVPVGDIVNQVLDELYDSQLFQDLLELIPLVDMNAETVIANILQSHSDWTLLGQNENAIVELAEITATEDYVEGRLQTELGLTWINEGMDAGIAQSSYIQGVQATVSDNSAEIEAIELFLVGNGNFDEPDPNSFAGSMSGLQETVDGHATDIDTLIQWQLSMASQFGGTPDNPDTMTAALESAYMTYADEESAAALAVETLQANTIPIWFSDNPPDYQTEPWASGIYTAEGASGFPQGATWYRGWTDEDNGYRVLAYTFMRGITSPSEVDGIGEDSPDHYMEVIPGIDGNAFGTGHGAWVLGEVSAVGALIQQISDVNITEDTAEARLQQLVQIVVDDNITAVEQTVESYLDEDGFMNSQWMVRMNQFTSGDVDGEPAIAGFGLGLQTDTENPEAGSTSNFIVMADRFAMVPPPETGSDLDGPLDPEEIVVPFLIDANNRNIFINGDLFINDTLYAYSGRLRESLAGRIVFGQMQSNPDVITEDYLDLVDEMGYRFELGSSTENFWTGTDNINYLMWAGTGAKNANNAVFFVDEDGNAFFGGVVSAGNISGSLADAQTVGWGTSAPGVHASSTNGEPYNWVDVGPEQFFTVDSIRAKRPVVQLAVRMSHGRSGVARLLMSYEQDPGAGNYTNYEEVYSGSCTMDRTDGETQIMLQGSIDGNIRGAVRFKIQIAGPYGQDIHSTGFNGLVFALPTSSTPTQSVPGHDETDPDDEHGAGDGDDSDNPPPPGGDGGDIIIP